MAQHPFYPPSCITPQEAWVTVCATGTLILLRLWWVILQNGRVTTSGAWPSLSPSTMQCGLTFPPPPPLQTESPPSSWVDRAGPSSSNPSSPSEERVINGLLSSVAAWNRSNKLSECSMYVFLYQLELLAPPTQVDWNRRVITHHGIAPEKWILSFQSMNKTEESTAFISRYSRFFSPHSLLYTDDADFLQITNKKPLILIWIAKCYSSICWSQQRLSDFFFQALRCIRLPLFFRVSVRVSCCLFPFCSWSLPFLFGSVK